VLDSVRLLVAEEKTDQDIADILQMKIADIYTIRRNILRISFYGRKKRCTKCNTTKSITCFHAKAEHPDWCIICRRKFGGETSATLGRPVIKRAEGYKKKEKNYVEVICLRCERVFKSEVFKGLGGTPDYYHLCDNCRIIITTLDRVSI